MFRQIILLLVGLLVGVAVFSSVQYAWASVEINEVHLSPTTERFIELYNSGSDTVDLTDWYIQRKTETGTSFASLVSKPNFAGKTIGAGSYFVISREPLASSDIVVSGLTLTESNTIQIKNSLGEVVDLVGWGSATICSGACASNPSDGQSIQKMSAGWITATPTPGGENANTSEVVGDGATSTSGGGAGGSSTAVSSEPRYNVKTKIKSKEIAFAGIPVSFEGSATGTSREKLFYGKYFWNFGDGSSRETKSNFATGEDKFTHTYFYAGQYTVMLEYYTNQYGQKPDATDQMTVRVVSPDIKISRTGDDKDFFIEISNQSNQDQDISLWMLKSERNNFTIPRNTILKSKNEIIISPKITNFSMQDKNTLRFTTPGGEVISDYGSSGGSSSTVSTPTTVKKDTQNKTSTSVSTTSEPTKVDTDDELTGGTLSALAIQGDALDVLGENEDDEQSMVIPSIFLVFLGASATGLYFLRKQRGTSAPGDEFKILE